MNTPGRHTSPRPARRTPRAPNRGDVYASGAAAFSLIVLVCVTSWWGWIGLTLPAAAGLLYAACRSPRFALGIIFAIYLLPLSVWKFTAVAGVDVRLAALPFIAALILRRRSGRNEKKVTKGWQNWASRHALWMIFGLAAASIQWSIDPEVTETAAGGLLISAVLCTVIFRRLSGQDVITVIGAIGIMGVLGSVLMAAFFPGLGIGGFDRVRGVFLNPNGLGAFVVVTLPAMIMLIKRHRWLACLGLIVLTGMTASRSATASVLLQCVILFASGSRSTGRRLLVGAVAATAAWLTLTADANSFRFSSSLPLFRENNSREDTWALGVSYFRSSQWVGVGVDAVPPGTIAGTGPLLLASVGAIGTAIVVLIYLTVAYRGLRKGSAQAALLLGVTINLIFEPWLITGGSFFCIAFWLAAGHPGWDKPQAGSKPKAGLVDRGDDQQALGTRPRGPGVASVARRTAAAAG